MMGEVHLLLVLAFLATFISAHSPPAKVIYQFAQDLGPSWLEGVLVKNDGDLLLTTLLPSASIYTLSRPWDSEPKITSNITLPNLDGALGMADLGMSKYAVAAAKFNGFTLVHGSSEIWVVDLANPKEPTQRHVASISKAGELNDIVVLKASSGRAKEILVADSTHGYIWKVSIETGAHSVWLDSPTMKADIDPEGWPFGINGLRYGTDGFLYFSNTNTRTIWRINPRPDGSASPNVEYVHEVSGAVALDNFAIDKDNRLWVASNGDNKLILVERHGSSWKSRVILGGETKHVVAGDTAVAFGHTAKEASALYVVTSGALASPVPPDDFKEPAKVVQVDVSGW